ncbi:MAG TPA: allophanate hydrolase [Gammaproteobacteria bacterium]|nr:allophanate hydrolase [Gammaproteobacteria bacterium]
MEISLNIASLHRGYREGRYTPAEVMDDVLARIDAAPDLKAWISRLPRAAVMEYVERLGAWGPVSLPLYGVPFVLKDNIDLAGVPTTAACPEFAYTPDRSAFVVQRLIDAGAVPLGKTNLDQFATGLNGTRSPYGVCANPFDPDYIAGGSSSGSAVCVALELASFALGTDTAGSGRVPAAFNNLVGLKPTRGLLSNRGVVPACRSLDCVSIFAQSSEDARAVLGVAAAFDPDEPFSRAAESPCLGARGVPGGGFRFAVPRADQLAFFGDDEYPWLFERAVGQLEALGGRAVTVDFEPFLETARLLYEGPWVTERYVAIEDFIVDHADALLPVTRSIIEAGARPSAADAFRASYRLAALRRASEAVWEEVDVLLTPTAGAHYTVAQMLAEPVRLNSELGYYTNFMNLLDLAAVAVPSGFRSDGLPFGVTLAAPAFTDLDLLQLAGRLHRAAGTGAGVAHADVGTDHAGTEVSSEAAEGELPMVVCGAHMSGLPLNHELTSRGGRLLTRTRTSRDYRFYLLPGGPPLRPGLVRVESGGGAIDVEVWALPASEVGGFIAGIPAPLGIGRVQLADGATAPGFVCEAYAAANGRDITDLGGWRALLAAEA